ncbi:hypothetical protein QCA50_001414 [Cerrena zonata]|uniref:Uncharacterized protein n=1 Tax=Cerrena zonata TaxID=2478898 RepID=A0AAW0GT88_9APHY
MSDGSDTKSEAAKLKDEGNALFVKKKYREAHVKYSAAIAKDDQNAVYFANRAACSLNLNKYLDATKDADQATKLDPLYSKAWARLAAAEHMLGNYENSVGYWQRALQTLPVENLTSAELKQKEEWTKDMTTVKRKVQRLQQTQIPQQRVIPQNETPWKRAKAMESELLRQGVEGIQSSVSNLDILPVGGEMIVTNWKGLGHTRGL